MWAKFRRIIGVILILPSSAILFILAAAYTSSLDYSYTPNGIIFIYIAVGIIPLFFLVVGLDLASAHSRIADWITSRPQFQTGSGLLKREDAIDADEKQLYRLIQMLKSKDKAKIQQAITQLKKLQWLSGGELNDTDFVELNLSGVDLTSASFRWCNLTKADLSNTDLTGADFSYAKLIKASLQGADLTSTNFSAADLTGANLTNAILQNTTMPNGEIYAQNMDLTSFGVKI